MTLGLMGLLVVIVCTGGVVRQLVIKQNVGNNVVLLPGFDTIKQNSVTLIAYVAFAILLIPIAYISKGLNAYLVL